MRTPCRHITCFALLTQKFCRFSSFHIPPEDGGRSNLRKIVGVFSPSQLTTSKISGMTRVNTASLILCCGIKLGWCVQYIAIWKTNCATIFYQNQFALVGPHWVIKLDLTGFSGPGSSVVGIATGYGLDSPGIESRWGARFSAPVQNGPGAHPASCTMGTRSFPRVKRGRGITLTPHPLLVPMVTKE